MRVTVLGSGGSAGVPMIGGADGTGDWGVCDRSEPRNRRTRSSIVLEGTGGRLLVDTSPDLRAQLLACAVPRIDAILFTHAHADHVLGLDEVRILNRIIDRPMVSYATATVGADLQMRFDYAFRPWQPPGFFRPVLTLHTVAPGDTIEALGLRIAVFDQDHGWSRTLGLRAGGFGYSTDVVDLPEPAFAALEGVDTWMIGCFQRPLHRTHASLERVLGWVARVRPRRAVLTHMGIDMDYGWLCRNLPPGVEPAWDGMVLDVPG